MISGTLTLFNWTLRSDAKTTGPHLARFGFAVFMMFAILAAAVDTLSATGPGLRFFRAACYMNVVIITVAGINYFVSAVTEEKDTGTLALLRMAGVTPLSIILGKSTSRLVTSLMLLLVQLPFTFLSLTLGGVTWKQVLAGWIALAAYMILVANLALFASVRCHTAGRAAMLTSVCLIFFYSINSLVTFVRATLSPGFLPGPVLNAAEILAAWQQDMSIVRRLEDVLETRTALPDLVDRQFWWSLLISSLLFTTSTLLFDRWGVSSHDTVTTALPRGRIRKFLVGRCWPIAFIWKDFQFQCGGLPFLLAKLIGYGLLVVGFTSYQSYVFPAYGWRLQGDTAGLCFVSVLGIIAVECLIVASGSLFAEYRQKTLSSLAMAPVATWRILLEKAGAAVVTLLPGLLVAGMLLLVDSRAAMHAMRSWDGDDGLGGMLQYLLLLSVCVHLTTWLSLYVRWAALPIALLVTFTLGCCCGGLTDATMSLVESASRSQNFAHGRLLGLIFNLVWVWLLILLPIQIDIVRQWDRLSQKF